MTALGPPVGLGPFVDVKTGNISPSWERWLSELYRRSGGTVSGTNVIGPATATDNAVSRFNGSTGGVLQDSLVLVSDGGAMSGMTTVDGRDVSVDGTALDAVVTESSTTTSGLATHIANVANPHAVGIRQLVNAIMAFETDIGQTALASAGTVTLLNATAGEQWKPRVMTISGEGTNFSGGGGDRNLAITDGTSTWSVIPATSAGSSLQALAANRWGQVGIPWPATDAHLTDPSGAGVDIVAQYSGGTTDYTAGQCTVIIIAERVT